MSTAMANAYHIQSWLYQMISKDPSTFYVFRLAPSVTCTFLDAFLCGHPIYLYYWQWIGIVETAPISAPVFAHLCKASILQGHEFRSF